MSDYSLILPSPWHRIHLGTSVAADVTAAVDRAVAQAPKEIPPDQLAGVRRRLERELSRQLDAAKAHGGVDFYVPAQALAGVDLNASFVVSSVIPDARADADTVPAMLAELVASGFQPVTLRETIWARSERVVASDGDHVVAAGLRARKVDYTTAVPGDERRWVLVSCSVIGDGDPDSEHTALVVELFDAIMTTWRWQERP